MKKGFYAILAALTVFSLVMTGCPDGGTPGSGPQGGETITIKFEAQAPANLTFDNTKVPADKTINKGASLGTDFPANLAVIDLSGGSTTDISFFGWYNGDTKVNASTAFSVNTTLTGKFGTPIAITFAFDNSVYSGANTLTAPAVKNIAPGESLGDDFPADVTLDDAIDFVFDAWYNGTVKVTASTTFAAATHLTGKFVVDERLKITFTFSDDDSTASKIIKLDEGQTFDAAGKKLPDPGNKEGYLFGQWVYSNPPVAVTTGTSFVVDTVVTQVWWINTLTSDGELEKLSLENAGLAIYKFVIPSGSKIGDYKEFRVTYKVTEAAIKRTQTRHRVYGEFGTFATQKTTKNENTFDSTDIDGWQEDAEGTTFVNAPKFNVGDWIFINSGRDLGWDNANITGNMIDPSTGNAVTNPVVTADTWFTLKYAIGDASANSPLTKNGTVYYALGLTTNGDSRNANTYWPNIASSNYPIVQLVKDVVLIHSEDSDLNVTAAIPAATEASFMAYASPNSQVWCWRGANADAIPEPPPPPPPPEFPPATAPYTKTITSVSLYQNDDAKTPDGRKRIIIAGNAVTFDLTADDYNQSPGEFGGGGFKILFADVGLPAINDEEGNPVTDYRSYSSITLSLTFAPLTSGTETDYVGKQIILSAIGNGGDVIDVNGLSGNDGRYVAISTGSDAKTYTFDVANLALGSDGAGLAVRANNWSSSNVPLRCKVTVNSIVFTP